MEVEVCNGSWQHGSILSIRIGGTRRQAQLQMNKRLAFAKGLDDAKHMQVDVFTRVSSSEIFIEPTQEVYQVATDTEGFSGLTLRLCSAGALQAKPKAYPRDGYPEISSGTGEDVSAEEKLEKVRQDTETYIEYYDLRQALQGMFQSVVKDRPEDPFDHMQAFLGEKAAKFFDQAYKTQSTETKVVADPEEEKRRAEQLQQHELLNADQAREIQKLKDSLEASTREVTTLRQRQEPVASSDAGQDRRALLEEQAKTADLQKKVSNLEDQIRDTRLAADTLLEEKKQLLQNMDSVQKRMAVDGEASSSKADMLAESENHRNKLSQDNKMLSDRANALQQENADLARRLQDSKILSDRADALQRENADLARRLQAGQANTVMEPPINGRATPGDEAAGSSRDVSRQTQKAPVEAAKTMEPQSVPPTATSLQSSTGFGATGGTSRGLPMGQTSRSEGPSFGSGLMPSHWAQASGSTVSTTAGTEVNTHMLSQLLASTYAPPVPPATYFETREDNEEDIKVLEANPQSNPEFAVDIVDCVDKTTNGSYAWVGTCNNRPLYRKLGSEPRYLYYAEVDPAWAGWWVADKMGAEEYNEWFREPADATLPVYCRKGELGSRVVETKLTREVVKMITKVGNQAEKVTIRSKLTEAFGAAFTKIDGSQRGLMSKTSPVVGIAHALEAQQRAIQLLHSQVSTEIQRREAAEAHAQTMEEAFETLQLRIQAQLPGAPPISPRVQAS
jgi:hypothetical protein